METTISNILQKRMLISVLEKAKMKDRLTEPTDWEAIWVSLNAYFEQLRRKGWASKKLSIIYKKLFRRADEEIDTMEITNNHEIYLMEMGWQSF